MLISLFTAVMVCLLKFRTWKGFSRAFSLEMFCATVEFQDLLLSEIDIQPYKANFWFYIRNTIQTLCILEKILRKSICFFHWTLTSVLLFICFFTRKNFHRIKFCKILMIFPKTHISENKSLNQTVQFADYRTFLDYFVNTACGLLSSCYVITNSRVLIFHWVQAKKVLQRKLLMLFFNILNFYFANGKMICFTAKTFL